MRRNTLRERKSRLRVFTGITGATTITVAIAITLMLSPVAAAADLFRFTYAGFGANFVVVNPSANAASVPQCGNGVCSAPLLITPYGSVRPPNYFGKNESGTVPIDLPAPLVLSTEMVAPNGSTISVPAQKKLYGTAQVQGFVADVDGDTTVTGSQRKTYIYAELTGGVDFYTDDKVVTTNVRCPAGADACFIPAPKGSNRAVINSLGFTSAGYDGHFYASAVQWDVGGPQEWRPAVEFTP